MFVVQLFMWPNCQTILCCSFGKRAIRVIVHKNIGYYPLLSLTEKHLPIALCFSSSMIDVLFLSTKMLGRVSHILVRTHSISFTLEWEPIRWWTINVSTAPDNTQYSYVSTFATTIAWTIGKVRIYDIYDTCSHVYYWRRRRNFFSIVKQLTQFLLGCSLFLRLEGHYTRKGWVHEIEQKGCLRLCPVSSNVMCISFARHGQDVCPTLQTPMQVLQMHGWKLLRCT